MRMWENFVYFYFRLFGFAQELIWWMSMCNASDSCFWYSSSCQKHSTHRFCHFSDTEPGMITVSIQLSWLGGEVKLFALANILSASPWHCFAICTCPDFRYGAHWTGYGFSSRILEQFGIVASDLKVGLSLVWVCSFPMFMIFGDISCTETGGIAVWDLNVRCILCLASFEFALVGLTHVGFRCCHPSN